MAKPVYTVLVLAIIAVVALHQAFTLHHILSKPKRSTIRNLKWNDINFLHTTDTHGWYSGHLNQKVYSGNWGDFVSFAQHLKASAHANGQDLLLIDSGDRHDGNGLSDITTPNGVASTPIFIKQDYDLLTIGNHELYLWENSKQEYSTIVTHFPDNYVSSNVEYIAENGTLVPFGNKYKYFETPIQKTRVLAFGFLFDFRKFNNGTKVTPIKEIISDEGWFTETLEDHSQKDDVDLIVIVTHVPIDHNWPELYYLHSYLRQFFPDTLIQYFGGHSHIRDFTIFDDKSVALQSGRYCETVGWVSIDIKNSKKDLVGQTPSIDNIKKVFARSYIDFNLKSFTHHSNTTEATFHTEKGLQVSKLIDDTRTKLDLSRPLGYIQNNYYVDYVPLNDHKNIFHLLTKKVLTSLSPKIKDALDERVVIINTGSIRYDLYKGPYTIDSQYIVSPFENKWVKVTIPKKVALKIAPKLNENGYILDVPTDNNNQKVLQETHRSDSIDNRLLLPPHQYNLKVQQLSDPKYPRIVSDSKLSKGYLTHDDFGSDGDDTVHKPVINYPIPSVVESRQLNVSTGLNAPVDLVFYDFITPNILWALNEVRYTGPVSVVEYSDTFLGTLLNEYIKKYDI